MPRRYSKKRQLKGKRKTRRKSIKKEYIIGTGIGLGASLLGYFIYNRLKQTDNDIKQVIKSREPYEDYWYDSDDIDTIMQLMYNKINANTENIFFLTALSDQEIGNLNENINNYFILNGLHKLNHFKLLIPINLGSSHWIGLLIEKNISGKNRILYLDSLGGKISPKLANICDAYPDGTRILNICGLLNINEITVVKNIYKQNDGSSCGPLTIENLFLKALDKPKENKTSSEFRIEQLLLLETGNNRYFQQMIEKF